MLEYLTNPIVYVLLVVILMLVYVLINIRKEGLKQLIINIVTKGIIEAEKQYGPGKGTIKKKYVIDMAIKTIPSKYKYLLSWLTVEYIDRILEVIFKEMKESSVYGPLVNAK